MEKAVSIEGMKCDGCVNIVKEKFEVIKGITSVIIDLEKKAATIKSEEELSIDLLKEALADTKFIVSD
ncbi:heavy-metal-associated domain-containing protein [Enterococcus rivorum]|uniref:Copper resistance protein CopZ n=1 Tax=Enterococcus rivorum TaxID=762845 RepID=A0A1E5KZA5_9ENTE|nr:heavy metal-associated domain-containing protein [Enterococcus rivorum]MBP2099362.1 copper chaperone CopZ [Enterococcus rivorum]OEH83227.1 copper resistance protein CopZ [Enterococcus rivorum]